MNQALVAHILQLRKIQRVVAIGALGTIVACGSGSAANVQNGNATGVSKNNMGTSKSSAVRSESAAASVEESGSNSPRGSGGTRTPVVLFFGTSLTAGYGLNPDQAFPTLIEEKARSEGVAIKTVNAGLSGETTAGAVRRIDWVLRTPADLVVIEAGANDALRGLSTAAAKANLEQLIAAVRHRQPTAKIALIQMEAPPNYGVSYTSSFRRIYSEVAAKEGLPLLPFLLAGVAGIPRLNQADGVHPNVTGEKIVADNVWKGLKPLVAQLDRGAKQG
ncbi:MAG: arylesterase [Gemmatimonadaceae bacterium]